MHERGSIQKQTNGLDRKNSNHILDPSGSVREVLLVMRQTDEFRLTMACPPLSRGNRNHRPIR